jgi:hypothetical protein
MMIYSYNDITRLMAAVTTCRVCGRAFEADHASIVAGTWSTCPACRKEPHRG